MFFLRKKDLNTQNSQENTKNLPMQDSCAESSQPPTRLNSSSKLSLFQKSQFVPDMQYENEAWAPETNVGLFHKHWSIVEEQISSSSGPQ